jgi:hypothetical protein
MLTTVRPPAGKLRYILNAIPVRMCANCKLDMNDVVAELIKHGVPARFIEGVREITFTSLPKRSAGDFLSGMMRFSYGREHWSYLPNVFVHEMAHNLDDVHGFSKNKKLVREFKSRAKFLSDGYAKKNIGEYIAVGFETFYFGTGEEVKTLVEKNPVLWKLCREAHEWGKAVQNDCPDP